MPSLPHLVLPLRNSGPACNAQPVEDLTDALTADAVAVPDCLKGCALLVCSPHPGLAPVISGVRVHRADFSPNLTPSQAVD
jgi:hypothetical protein